MAGLIDLRSDTVTQPTSAMRQAMATAETGDDVYGDDPTVNALEAYAASLLGKEASVFCPTGTQSNLVGLLSHCARGDEYLVGRTAHTFLYEGGGAAVLGSIQPQTIALQKNGVMDLAELVSAIKPKDVHFARTRLICLENTHNGRSLPTGYTGRVNAIAAEHGLRTHLDGARLFNAVVDTGMAAAELVADFDSVSICLSKGLGAPVGSLLAGSAALIDEARHWRKMLGGGMRQSGILAAAGLYALQNNVQRLADDHNRAEQLAQALGDIGGVELLDGGAHTNMLYVKVNKALKNRLSELSVEHGVVLPDGEQMRLVVHLDIDDSAIAAVVALFQAAVG